MEMSHDPHEWSLRQWLVFLLLTAASVDGKRAHNELRYLSVELGKETLDAMVAFLDRLDASESERILQESLPIFLRRPNSREKLQRLLRDVFMADGEYAAEEQVLTKKIGDWIRAANLQ